MIALFAYLCYRGFRVALNARDDFGSYLAMGIVAWIAFQALINIGGITRSIPLTGIPLPFLSYGGSALVMTMAAIGVLLSVSRYGKDQVYIERPRTQRTRQRACGNDDMRVLFLWWWHRRARLSRAHRRPGPARDHLPAALAVARWPEALDLLYIGVSGKIDAELVAREGIPFKAVDALAAAHRHPDRHDARRNNAGLRDRGGLPHLEWLSSGRRVRDRRLRQRRRGHGRAPPEAPASALSARCRGRPGRESLWRRSPTKSPSPCRAALDAVPKDKATVTGYPVRPQFYGIDRAAARAHLGLHESLPVLLVSGASSGANAINRAVAAWASDFLRLGQLVHICGPKDEPWLRQEREKLSPELQARYHLHAYLHDDMPYALAAADIAVMRSGASTLGELPATRLPAVLVPGEYEGWDQSPNARYLEGEGAAVLLPQSRLEADLRTTVMGLLGDSERRQRMQEALSRLARPDAALKLAQMLLKMAGGRSGVTT